MFKNKAKRPQGFDKFLIRETATLREAMLQMDMNRQKALLVVDDNQILLGSLSDGDIRRKILQRSDLNQGIKKAYNRRPKFVHEDFEMGSVKVFMVTKKIEWIPVVNKNKQIVRIIFWDDLFRNQKTARKRHLNIPIVIMAGGTGKRMKPFTDILPKPLIPIKGKPVIEVIMEKFHEYGIKEFYVSVNYKSRIIKAYFEETKLPFEVRYITEHIPMGTAGSLRYLLNKVKGDFLVTNCDTIINADYSDMVAFHKKNKNDITIIGSLKNFVIPYGICEIDDRELLKEIREKPEYDFLINTGMYILNHSVLKQIEPGKVSHMTDLIRKIRSNSGKIGVFPISEKSWVDIGQWEEYRKILKNFDEF